MQQQQQIHVYAQELLNMKNLILTILILLLSSCMSVADFVKASDLLDAKLAPYREAIGELKKNQDLSNQAITLIDEKAGTKVLAKQEKTK